MDLFDAALDRARRKRAGSVVDRALHLPDAADPDAPSWRDIARPSQLPPPGEWVVWMILAGRGWGKTRCLTEWVHEQVDKGRRRIALVGPTAADVRDVIIEGESGILATAKDRPVYEPSKRRITWPNGAQAFAYSADEPERLRGPQHDAAACDEVAAWRYPEAWDQLMFGLRLGDDPRAVVATTPKPTKLIRELAKSNTTVLTRGTTYENLDNLAPAFASQIIQKYEGTRLGRQELNAEILEDIEGALWTRAMLDDHRTDAAPTLTRIVVAVDPAVTNNADSDETGIIVAGLGDDGHGYILDDLSAQLSPDGWARRAVEAYRSQDADRIVGEVNNGGDLVEVNIRTVDRNASYKAVRASRGKRSRAEPVAALYEQGKIHHIGSFPELEDQLCGWVPNSGMKSPDRLDAAVWALTELMLGAGAEPFAFAG